MLEGVTYGFTWEEIVEVAYTLGNLTLADSGDGTVKATHSDTSSLSSVDTVGYGKPNQSRIWFNGPANRWDALVPRNDGGPSASDHYLLRDVTDKQTTEASAEQAEKLGITAFFDANKGKTGTIGILDPATGEAVEVFKGETDAKAYDDPLAVLLKPS